MIHPAIKYFFSTLTGDAEESFFFGRLSRVRINIVMAYRTIKSWTGTGANNITAGRFPHTYVPFKANPVNAQEISITFNNVVRTYGFYDTHGAATHFVSPPTSACQIGSTIEQTIANLICTINSDPHATKVGTDGTISLQTSGTSGLMVYGNSKMVTAPVITHVSDSGGVDFLESRVSQTGAVVVGAYGMADGYANAYSAISFATNGPHDVLVVDNPNDDGYNIGPPKSNLKVVSVNLNAGVIHEITTLGSKDTCTLYG